MIVVAGKNNIAIAITDFLINRCSIEKKSIRCIFNTSDDGVDGWQKSFKKYCNYLSVKEIDLDEVYLLDDLIFLSLEFDTIVDPDLFHASARMYNIHFSLLPAYKGMYTSAWVLLNQEEFTGVTFHEIDHGIDTGNIVAQSEIEISEYETARTLYHKYLSESEKLITANMKSILSGTYSTVIQPAIGSSYYSRKSIDYKNITVDLTQVASNIENQIRAFCFREYQYPRVGSVSVIGCSILRQRSKRKVGLIVKEHKYFIDVSTVDYDVRLFKEKLLDDFFCGVKEDNISLITNILELYPNIKFHTHKNGYTAAMISAYGSNVDIFSLVFHHNMIEWCNYNGTNLLMYAKSGYVKTGIAVIYSRLLKEYPGLVKKKDHKGFTVVDYIISNGERDALSFISN